MRIQYSNTCKIFNVHTGGIPYLSVDMLDRLGVPNAYTTRYLSYDAERGIGESGLRTAWMNFEEREEALPVILKNRNVLAKQLGSSIEMECTTDQKHTNHVHVVKPEDIGVVDKPTHRLYVDGLVTDIPGVLLTAYGGDCPPVYIADPVHKAIGLVHAGWRGTLGRIPAVAIAQMTVHFGSNPADLYAAIGPGICMDCYEMGDEVYDAFEDEWGKDDADRILRRYPPAEAAAPRKYHLDLREANRLTLLNAGISSDHIAVSNVCTKCNVDTFYSYRAHRMENEQSAMIVNSFGML